MARKSAIHITSAEIASAEHRSDTRRDAAAEDNRPPSTLELIRAARDMLTEAELLRVCRSAARLELRPPAFTPEDREDCSAELAWHSLAEHNGAPPLRHAEHATLTYFCGLARNWRARKLTSRAADAREAAAAEDAYAISAAAALEAAEDATYADGYREAAAEQAAAAIVARLGLPSDGPVFSILYQMARDCTAEQAAAERRVKLSAWKMRAKRGGETLRALFPESTDLLGFLMDGDPCRAADGSVIYGDDCSREAGSSSPGWIMLREREQRPREGTAGGERPERPETAEDAREACLVRHQCPAPGLAGAGASRNRRGHYVAAPMIQSSSPRAPRGFLWVEGRTPLQARADALRNLAREAAERTTREASVHPSTVGKWDNPS